MPFGDPVLLPGEIHRAKLAVYVDFGNGILMWRYHLHLTNRRLLLTRPRISHFFVLPLLPIALIIFQLFGLIAAVVVAAVILWFVFGQQPILQEAIVLSDVATSIYRKSGSFFIRDSVEIRSTNGKLLRVSSSGRQAVRADAVVAILEEAGFTVSPTC